MALRPAVTRAATGRQWRCTPRSAAAVVADHVCASTASKCDQRHDLIAIARYSRSGMSRIGGTMNHSWHTVDWDELLRLLHGEQPGPSPLFALTGDIATPS